MLLPVIDLAEPAKLAGTGIDWPLYAPLGTDEAIELVAGPEGILLLAGSADLGIAES